MAAASMSSAVYNALARSKLLRDVERAFRDATGLSLKLVPGGEPQRRLALGTGENAFCAMMGTSGCACAASNLPITFSSPRKDTNRPA
jgi:hypothetical protein